jgi:hypothetical protein
LTSFSDLNIKPFFFSLLSPLRGMFISLPTFTPKSDEVEKRSDMKEA